MLRFGSSSEPLLKNRCLKDTPVPGSEAVPYTPRGPTFTVRGDPPMLQLRPLLDRLSLTPGIILNDLRKRQPILFDLHCFGPEPRGRGLRPTQYADCGYHGPDFIGECHWKGNGVF
jgi:hypothetical protein